MAMHGRPRLPGFFAADFLHFLLGEEAWNDQRKAGSTNTILDPCTMDTMVRCVSSSDVGLASIRKVLQNCLVFKSIYLVDFPITELFRKQTLLFPYWFDAASSTLLFCRYVSLHWCLALIAIQAFWGLKTLCNPLNRCSEIFLKTCCYDCIFPSL